MHVKLWDLAKLEVFGELCFVRARLPESDVDFLFSPEYTCTWAIADLLSTCGSFFFSAFAELMKEVGDRSSKLSFHVSITLTRYLSQSRSFAATVVKESIHHKVVKPLCIAISTHSDIL